MGEFHDEAREVTRKRYVLILMSTAYIFGTGLVKMVKSEEECSEEEYAG